MKQKGRLRGNQEVMWTVTETPCWPLEGPWASGVGGRQVVDRPKVNLQVNIWKYGI